MRGPLFPPSLKCFACRAAIVGLVFVMAWGTPARSTGLECPETGKGAVSVALPPDQARLLSVGGSIDLGNEIEELIVRLKNERPGLSYGDLTDALIAAYCPIVANAPSLSAREKLARIAKFDALVRQRLNSDTLPSGSSILANVPLSLSVYRALRDQADRAGRTPSELMTEILTKAADGAPER